MKMITAMLRRTTRRGRLLPSIHPLPHTTYFQSLFAYLCALPKLMPTTTTTTSKSIVVDLAFAFGRTRAAFWRSFACCFILASVFLSPFVFQTDDKEEHVVFVIDLARGEGGGKWSRWDFLHLLSQQDTDDQHQMVKAEMEHTNSSLAITEATDGNYQSLIIPERRSTQEDLDHRHQRIDEEESTQDVDCSRNEDEGSAHEDLDRDRKIKEEGSTREGRNCHRRITEEGSTFKDLDRDRKINDEGSTHEDLDRDREIKEEESIQEDHEHHQRIEEEESTDEDLNRGQRIEAEESTHEDLNHDKKIEEEESTDEDLDRGQRIEAEEFTDEDLDHDQKIEEAETTHEDLDHDKKIQEEELTQKDHEDHQRIEEEESTHEDLDRDQRIEAEESTHEDLDHDKKIEEEESTHEDFDHDKKMEEEESTHEDLDHDKKIEEEESTHEDFDHDKKMEEEESTHEDLDHDKKIEEDESTHEDLDHDKKMEEEESTHEDFDHDKKIEEEESTHEDLDHDKKTEEEESTHEDLDHDKKIQEEELTQEDHEHRRRIKEEESTPEEEEESTSEEEEKSTPEDLDRDQRMKEEGSTKEDLDHERKGGSTHEDLDQDRKIEEEESTNDDLDHDQRIEEGPTHEDLDHGLKIEEEESIHEDLNHHQRIDEEEGSLHHIGSVQEVVAFPDNILLLVKTHSTAESLSAEDYECIYELGSSQTRRSIISIDQKEAETHNYFVKCPQIEQESIANYNSSSYITLRQKRQSDAQIFSKVSFTAVRSWAYLVYESFSLSDSVVVFVKGRSFRRLKVQNPREFECVYGDDVIRTEVLMAAQEVFRCRKPPPSLEKALEGEKITLRYKTRSLLLPSAAQFKALNTPLFASQEAKVMKSKEKKKKHLVCVCSMIWNQARFLLEWIMYHSALGVERWFLYDNNSDDETSEVIQNLSSKSGGFFNVSRHAWPWIKTQEAGFSHCALRAKSECEWMMFIDTDEFVYPKEYIAGKNPSIFPSIISNATTSRNQSKDNEEEVGEIRINCHNFGPSGLSHHPEEGVSVGYTCRMQQAERHKSIVQLEALHPSLLNVVHHFSLKPGFASVSLPLTSVVINHYKYQVWEVFRNKFVRRVATYITDWTEKQNEESRDRTPGLGTEPVEPSDWPFRFCQINDTGLQHFVFSNFSNPLTLRLPWQQ